MRALVSARSLAWIVIAFACLTFAQTKPDVPAQLARFDTIPVAEGVYVFQPPVVGEAAVTGNSLVVIGDGGVLVVDSGHFPSLTVRQIEQIRHWTNQPVRYLVNTHGVN